WARCRPRLLPCGRGRGASGLGAVDLPLRAIRIGACPTLRVRILRIVGIVVDPLAVLRVDGLPWAARIPLVSLRDRAVLLVHRELPVGRVVQRCPLLAAHPVGALALA